MQKTGIPLESGWIGRIVQLKTLKKKKKKECTTNYSSKPRLMFSSLCQGQQVAKNRPRRLAATQKSMKKSKSHYTIILCLPLQSTDDTYIESGSISRSKNLCNYSTNETNENDLWLGRSVVCFGNDAKRVGRFQICQKSNIQIKMNITFLFCFLSDL